MKTFTKEEMDRAVTSTALHMLLAGFVLGFLAALFFIV